jgi:hypothetical protein
VLTCMAMVVTGIKLYRRYVNLTNPFEAKGRKG